MNPPVQNIISQLQTVDDFVAAGDTAQAELLLETLGQQLQAPFDRFPSLGQLEFALALEDADLIDSAIVQVELLIQQFSLEIFRPRIAYARGQAHMLRGNYRDAITNWEQEQELNPGDWSINRQLGEAYRELGELDRAEELILLAQRNSPASPRTRYELALVYEAQGRRDEAIAELRAALDVLSDADPHYKWAVRTREKLAELEGNRR